MSDYSAFNQGGTAFPLATGTGNTLLQDADPAVFFALDYFKFAITQYAGARFSAEVAGVGAAIPAIVSTVVPYDPHEYLAEAQYKFPLLAVYRGKSLVANRTKTWRHDDCEAHLDWVLPPITAGQMEVLWPIGNAIKDILDHACQQGHDPGYTPPGSTLDAVVWKLAGVEEIGVTSVEWGKLPGGSGNLFFPTLHVSLHIVERVVRATPDSFTPFAGADVTITLGTGDGTIAPNFSVQVATQLPPAPTSVLATSGSVTGGLSVTVMGSLFGGGGGVQGVTFGGRPATSVVKVNATTITCVTPAHTNPGAVDIVVTNLDGQIGTLAGAFTYTTP